MPAIKNIFFLVLCLLIGLGIGKAFVAFRNHAAAPHNFEKHEDSTTLITGTGDAPGNRGFTLQSSDLPNLHSILQQSDSLFATTLALEYSPTITRAQLIDAVTQTHRRHLSFILLPPPHFTLENPYPRAMADIAADAQAANVDILCISWLNADPDPAYWKGQTVGIRKVFEGRLILAATPAAMPSIGCWDVADILGAIGPVDLPHRLSQADGDLSVHDLRVAWDSSLTSLESLARINTKPLALLHSNIPANAAASSAILQSAYEALLLETKGRAQVTEVLLFNWNADAAAPNQIPELLPKFRDAWDPKKPKPPDVLPPDDSPENTPEDPADTPTSPTP